MPRLDNTPVPFEVAGGASLAVTSTTGSVALAGGGEDAIVTNPGQFPVYIAFGTSGVAATVASQCILPGTQVAFRIPEPSQVRATHLAAITSSAAQTATIQVSTGKGV